MTDRLITDPWRELTEERKRHAHTLELLAAFNTCAALLTAGGTPSDEICKLCHHAPVGVHPVAWRAGCPCRAARKHVPKAQEMLAVPLDRPRQTRSAPPDVAHE